LKEAEMTFKNNLFRSSHVRFVVMGLTLQFFLLLHMQYESVREEINQKLYMGAFSLKYYLGEDFISKDLNKNSLTSDESFENFTSLHEKSIKIGVDYLYLLVKDGEDIVYAALSDSSEEITGVKNNGFWLSLREAEDDSFEETLKAFEGDDPVYLESSDIWDSYRSIYLPQVSKDGIKYLAGADITISNLNREVLFSTLRIFLPFLTLFIILIPLGKFLIKSFYEKERLEDYIAYLNKKDSLTGIYNRKAGLKLLSHYLNNHSPTKRPFSIFLIGIDNLDFINKTLGMGAGDNLLIILVNILKVLFRKTDNIMRLEGNKFLVMLEDFDLASLGHVNKLIKRRLDYFNKNNKNNYFIRVNYVLYEYDGKDPKDFLEGALLQLRYLKANKNIEERELQNDILKGIKEREFVTHFQPKVDIDEKTVSFEALVRWIHPVNGIILPDKFIPLAEKCSIINEITRIVLEDSLIAAEILGREISINLSPTSLDNDDFFKDLLKKLKHSKASKLISFEITERSAINNFDDTLRKIKTLNRAGIFVSIDDFGVGYSSLSYLDVLPVKEVKIDKSFVDNINTSRINSIIVETVIKIGRINGFKVTCEGVETSEQVRTISRLGGVSFQGYYFGRAEELSIVTQKLNSNMYLNKVENIKVAADKDLLLKAINH